MTAVFLATVPGRPACVAVIAALALAFASCSSSPGSPTVATNPTTTTMAAGTTPPSTATSTTAAGTQQVRFDPFSAQGTLLPTEQVTVRVSGTCVTPGVAGTSSYRCFAQPDSAIYDPCFAPPGVTSGAVECIADPAAPEVVEFDAGALPHAPPGAPATRPWAMQLANGQVCILVAAAWGGLGPFACPTPGATNSVADCHVPQQAAPWWSSACQAQERATSAFSAARVVRVWT
jgi:hypothetical protein